MSLRIAVFFSPSFYVRTGFFVIAVVLSGLLFLRVDSHTWLLYKYLLFFAAALITGGIFGYFRILPFRQALSEICKGFLKIVIGFVAICCAAAAFLFWWADPLNLSAPEDQTLVKIFHKHHEALAKLGAMATEDLGGIHYITQYAIEGDISESRKQEYQALLWEIYPRSLRYPGLRVLAGPDGVWYIFASAGLSAISGGWRKGIAYYPGVYQGIATIVQNLDRASELRAGFYLREIEPEWYIVYQNPD